MIVLAGSVLTAYVGVTGLMRRLALDRVLPAVFMRTNKLRGTPHWIIIGFFVLTASLYLLLAAGSSNGEQQMNDLGGVYALVSVSTSALRVYRVAGIIYMIVGINHSSFLCPVDSIFSYRLFSQSCLPLRWLALS